MVKPNTNNDNLHAPKYILEEKDKKLIENTFTDVKVEEAKFSNPANALSNLYILISSEERDDLYSDKTKKEIRKIAREIRTRDPNNIEKGNFPTHKQSSRYDDYQEDYYTLALHLK